MEDDPNNNSHFRFTNILEYNFDDIVLNGTDGSSTNAGDNILLDGTDENSSDGYFLGGRSLTGVVIAGSLLLTNLSTEQLVGLNGSAYKEGILVMAWETLAALTMVVTAIVLLPTIDMYYSDLAFYCTTNHS